MVKGITYKLGQAKGENSICDAFWLRVRSVNFDFSAKSSSTDYNESNEPTTKSLAHIGFEKLLVELGVPNNELFHFFTFFVQLKSLLFTLSCR